MQNKQNFMDLFTDHYEFPNVADVQLITKESNSGILFEYVSNTYLKAYINSVRLVAGYGVTRYTALADKDIEDIYINSNLSDYDDDIVLLAISDEGTYYFFYFDCDVSDCMIGTFKYNHMKQEEILSLFDEWVKGYNKSMFTQYRRENEKPEDVDTLFRIDIKRLKGWIT